MAVTYLILFHIFLQNSFVANASIEAGLHAVLADLNKDDFTSTAIQAEKARISNIFYKMKSKWTAIKRVKEKFEMCANVCYQVHIHIHSFIRTFKENWLYA